MDTNRLEAFSDAVMAIAITLLVLEISVPSLEGARDGTLGPALLELWPSYVAYVVSFLVIGAIWINHHAMFRYIARADGTLVLLNVLQLMLIAFLPFPTAVLAEAFSQGVNERIAAAFYAGTLTLLGILINMMWRHAARECHLLSERLTRAEVRRIGRRYLVGPVIYAAATVVALVVPWLAVAFFFLVNVFYLWPRKETKQVTAETELPREGVSSSLS